VPFAATCAAAEGAAFELLGQAGMVAVRVRVRGTWPRRRGGGWARTAVSALVTAGAAKIATGDLVVFCKAGGRFAPGGGAARWAGPGRGASADHARLGLAEERLDALGAGRM